MKIKVDIGRGWDDMQLDSERAIEIFNAIKLDLETLSQTETPVKRLPDHEHDTCDFREIRLNGFDVKRFPDLSYIAKDLKYMENQPYIGGSGHVQIGEQKYTHGELDNLRKSRAA